MSNNHTAAKVMLVGFSERQQALFAQLFKQSDYQGFTLVDTAPVDVAIVDLDASNSEHQWQEFRHNFQTTPAITVSLTPQSHKGPYWLSKPINPHALKSLLISLNPRNTSADSLSKAQPSTHIASFAYAADAIRHKGKLDHVRRCSNSDLSFHPKAAVETYQVDDYLEGKLKYVITKANKTPLRLRGYLHGEPLPGELFILPESHRIATNIKPHLLRALSLINLNHEKASLEFVPFTQPVPPLETTMHWHTFLWQLSLWTSRGRLQHSILPTQAITLTQWPNFTLLSEFPYALKLAACLARNGCIPESMSNKQEVPLPYVYSFLSATHSLGLLKKHTETDTQPMPAAARGLFQRMLKRLTTGQP